ncbi:YfhO family protein [Scatolibacter rhodanostii]|uniref:YfhO family protein n=1 Tax=Scatolibacter rhodanostii TaxID=2014781 RepID=UPI001FA86710|nr:YfhO family protein [Scatolibacter rhodanostii]
MNSIMPKSPKPTWRDNYFLRTFLIALMLSSIVFVPFIFINGGRFLFYGDFNVQQVPFYKIAHDAIREGNIGWNHLTDLGANFIGSYSFYLLGSPFFWLTIPFPSEWLQYLMGPLFMLKFACAGLTAYIYLHRYVKNQTYAMIGSILYAFSGFSLYNVFFNHFHEAIVFFPLMLAALDEYMETRRRGVFALAVAACAIVNYYFFVGQVVFTLIYFFLRLICKSWRISLKDILLLFLEAVLGVALSGVILLPSIFTILQNNRVNSPINGWDAVFYNKTQRYLHILQSLFFPPDLPARPNFTPDSGSKWASLGAWLPLFGMTGVIGWLQIRRKHWLKKFLFILFFMALVPGLNASFQLFNSAYYGRWLYMLTLMMSLATIMAFEYHPVDWKRAVTWTGAITAGVVLIVGFIPKIEEAEDGTEKTYSFGLMEYPDRFWTYAAIAFICLAITVFLLQCYKNKEKRFAKNTIRMVSLVAVLYSAYFIAIGKTQTASPYTHIIPYALNGGKDVQISDLRDDAVRTDFYESLDNSAMFWGVQSIQAFHSIVPGSVMEFYESIGVQRDVASRPETSHYALRGLTSVKWLFDESTDTEYFAGEANDEPQMPGWIYHGYANGFDIWENEYYIPMGFTYEYYISRSDFDALSESQRELVMLKAIVLEDYQIERLSGILKPLPQKEKVYTQEAYFEDCQKRAKESCYSFHYTNTGFTAEIQSSRSNLVFFSVPYESGWSAEVNGEKQLIEKTNVGFMSVQVPQGEKVVIEFTYQTPGLVAGVVLTLSAMIALVAYLVMMRHLNTGKGNRKKLSSKILERQSFAQYRKRKNVNFSREGAMVPLQYKLPEPQKAFAEIEKSDIDQ